MKRKLTTTSDGSSTIYIPEMDEHYHSSHGAIQEARHVFIKHGLQPLESDTIRIFEMGFGTGLNALLTYQFAHEHGKTIEYIGIEAFPVEDELIEGLNYVNEIDPKLEDVFNKIHAVNWNEFVEISPFFKLKKVQQKLEEFIPESKTIDLVYYDAFGPRAQEEMWDKNLLEKMYDLLFEDGVLVSYCAKGQFKRDLKSLGLTVEALPGPPGKREMTRGTKS